MAKIKLDDHITNKNIADFLDFTERAIYQYKKLKDKSSQKENEKKNNEKENKKNKVKYKRYNIYSSAKLAIFLNKNKENISFLEDEITELQKFCNDKRAKEVAENILEFLKKIKTYLDFN
jgi:hypothetical protein